MIIKTAAVYSGVSYQRGVFIESDYSKKFDVIPATEFSETDISSYDILLFPRGTDEEAMLKNAGRIEDFLNSGKVVISMGEIPRNWLPGTNWDGVIPEDDGPLDICTFKKGDADVKHEIFENIEPNELHWHKGATGWCCHGHLIPPENAEILVVNKRGDAMMYIDRESTKGTLLITSQLDAICHSYHGVEGAKKVLDNILKWAEKEVMRLRGVDNV